MVRLVDEALRDPARFAVAEGLASAEVKLVDPAVGTGTYLLGVLRRIAEMTAADQGAGAVPGVIRDALRRLIGFELQFGSFAVAQFRLLAEVADLFKVQGTVPAGLRLRLYVTDTLGNPDEEHEYIPHMLKPLAESRRQANAIKRAEPITVVIGNPPYKKKAKGRGGWVEAGSANTAAPLQRWMPPADWRVGAHTKHLRNLYAYFWRWATWKVFGDGAMAAQAAPGRKGVVCFIMVAGFLNGPGFQAMRDDLSHNGRDLGGGLLARGAPTRRRHAHLPGRAAAGVHRAGGADGQARCNKAGAGAIPVAAGGRARGEVCGAGRAHPRRRGLGGLPAGLARAVPAWGDRRVGDLSRA